MMRYRKLKLMISYLYWLSSAVYKFILSLTGKKPPGKCVVIYYHDIKEAERDKFTRQMKELLKYAEVISADTAMRLEDGKNYVIVTFDDGFQTITANALPLISSMNIPYTIFIPTRYIGREPGWEFDDQEKNSSAIMTEGQIKIFNSHSGAIGSHSDSHPMLTQLSEEKAFDEIQKSKEVLESICNAEVSLFSFPYGEYNSKLAGYALSSGYKRVFTSKPHVIYSEFNTPVIGRFPVNPTDSLLQFRLTILGAYVWMDKLFALKRKMRSFSVIKRGNSKAASAATGT